MEKKRRKRSYRESDKDEFSVESDAKKQKVFSAVDFRKELREGNMITSLKNFLSIVQKDETIVEDYLEAGGSPQEILLLLDKTAKTDLTSAMPVFRMLHLIFLRVNGSDSRYYSSAQDGAKFLLNSFIPTIRGMLDISSNKHRKVVLKLLTSVVTLFPYYARDIMSLIPDMQTVLKQFLKPESSNDSVRKWFIFFILSFIVGGDFEVIQNVMNVKGLLSGIISDLKFDEAHTVNVFLSVLEEKVLKGAKVPKTMKLKVFNTQVITALFDLYEWKSPRNVHINGTSKKHGMKEKEVSQEAKNLVVESVHSFLMVLCTSKKFGIAFTDRTIGSSGDLKNNLLSTVVQSLSDPWENKKMSEIIIAMIVSCPDLMSTTLSRMEAAIQPRESKKWNVLVQFVEKLLSSIDPRKILLRAEESPEMDIVSVAKHLCAPNLLVRNMSSGLRSGTNCSSILYYSMRLLTLMWNNSQDVLSAFRGHYKLRKTLISSFSNCFMDAEDVLIVWQKICSGKSWTVPGTVDRQGFLNVVLDFLEMAGKCDEKNVMDSPCLIASKMLDILDSVHESGAEIDYVNIQLRIFHMLTSIDPMCVTPDTDLFKRAVKLLLSNYSRERVESVAKIIVTTGVFENNESEIDIWLACYFDDFDCYRDAVPDFIADAVSRLYLKEFDVKESMAETRSKNTSIFEELMDTDTNMVVKNKWASYLAETPTPMLSQSLEMVRTRMGRERDAVRRYVGNVAFRLFHYYNSGRGVAKICRGWEDELGPSVFQYFTDSDAVGIAEDQFIFRSRAERKVLAWLTKGKKRVNVDELLKEEDVSALGLFLTFNTLTSYLIGRVKRDSLGDADASKLTELFGYFLGLSTFAPRDTSRIVVSHDVNNASLLRGKFIHAFLSLPLVDKFDVCEGENESVENFTRIAVTVLMAVEEGSEDPLLRPWKRQLLETMRRNIGDSEKTSEVFRTVEPLFHRFRYSPEEYYHILAEYCDTTDMKTFVSDGYATMSTMVLTKLAKLQCDHFDPDQRLVRQLWKIAKWMTEEAPTSLSIMDDCFVHILRNRPKTLSLLGNDFLENLLARSEFHGDIAILWTLLLRDPAKVEHSLTFAIKNFRDLKNKEVVVSMMSAVIFEDGKDDSFLSFLRSKKLYSFWTESELAASGNESVIFELGRLIYRKYRSHIVAARWNKQEFISRYCRLFSLLAQRFHEKEDILGMMDSLREGSFLPEVLHETLLKYKDDEEIIRSYATGLLVMSGRRLKEGEGKGEECDSDIWTALAKYAKDLANVANKYKWKEITEESTWKDWVRTALRTGFNARNGAFVLATLRYFLQLFYDSEGSARDVALIFDMLISHSQFLSVMLHRRSQLKREIVSLYLELVTRNPSVLSAKHVPVILAAYSASLSETDRSLLKILRFYESKSIDMSEYEPLVWSDSAASHYSVRSDVGVSLWRRMNMLNVLDLLDGRRMKESLLRFPVDGKGDDESLYDPEFLLPIFGNLLSPGAVTYCIPFVQKGCLAYVLCALSSASKEVRLAASSVLARFHNHLELIRTKLKLVWLHLINCLRYGVGDIEVHPVPSVVTQFLARISLELSGEPGDMFTSLQKFLLAKPVFNLDYVPEFLPLFHSPDVYYAKHRRWILEVLRDGLKQNVDLDLVFQTVAVKMILSYFKSQFCSRESKLLVMQVLINGLEVEKSKLLISEYGVLSWLGVVASGCDKELFDPFIRLVSIVAGVALNKLVGTSPKRRNLFYPIQILNVLAGSLTNLAACRSADTFCSFLRIVLDSLLVLAKFRHTNWCKLNEGTFRKQLTRIAAAVIGDECLAEKICDSRTFFASAKPGAGVEDLYRRIYFLWDVLLGFDSGR